jgi:hypothetical protein
MKSFRIDDCSVMRRGENNGMIIVNEQVECSRSSGLRNEFNENAFISAGNNFIVL